MEAAEEAVVGVVAVEQQSKNICRNEETSLILIIFYENKDTCKGNVL